MDAEERKDDELFMLGCVTGLCQQEPRDQILLEQMLLFMQEAQEVRISTQSVHEQDPEEDPLGRSRIRESHRKPER